MATEITEIFVMTMKDAARADAVRERACNELMSLDSVDSWRSVLSIHPEKQTLFAKIYEFTNEEAAHRETGQFAQRTGTKATLAEIDELLVGQHFVEHQPGVTTNE